MNENSESQRNKMMNIRNMNERNKIQVINRLCTNISNELYINLSSVINIIKHDTNAITLEAIYDILKQIYLFVNPDIINHTMSIRSSKSKFIQLLNIIREINNNNLSINFSMEYFGGSREYVYLKIARVNYSEIIFVLSNMPTSRFHNNIFCSDLLSLLQQYLNIPCKIKK